MGEGTIGRGGIEPRPEKVGPAGLSQVLDGESDRYLDPVWRVEVCLSGVERDLLAQPEMRRLRHVAHAGAASMVTPQRYSRLEHSLGVLALVAQVQPDDELMRVAALVHDIGHLPLSHTLERPLGVSHHDLGDAILRKMSTVFARHGIDVDEVVESVHGRGSSALGTANGQMVVDHFESYVRSAHAHGTTRESPRDTLASVTLREGEVSCSEETASYLRELIIGEAERHAHTDNVRSNAVVACLVKEALTDEDAPKLSELATMTDHDLWAWLLGSPQTATATQELLTYPERWAVRAVDTPSEESGDIDFEISRFYLDPPLVDGDPAAWRADELVRVQRLPRRFAVAIPADRAGGSRERRSERFPVGNAPHEG